METCPWCGVSFDREHYLQKFCCEDHQLQAANAKKREKWKNRDRDKCCRRCGKGKGINRSDYCSLCLSEMSAGIDVNWLGVSHGRMVGHCRHSG
jgi:hypothetical protein